MHTQRDTVFKAYVQRIRARLHGIMHQRSGGGGTIGDTGTTTRRRLQAPIDSLCAITDVGRRRNHNEDTFHISDNGKSLVVADGMGGHAAGEVASTLAVEALIEFFTTDTCHKAGEADARPIEALLREAFATVHRKVRAASRHRVEYHGMGTTLIVAYIHGNRLYTCHIGEVRCYLRAAASLEQITQDHSVAGALVRAGELSPAQARVHPMKYE
jgi:protein phosphatase